MGICENCLLDMMCLNVCGKFDMSKLDMNYFSYKAPAFFIRCCRVMKFHDNIMSKTYFIEKIKQTLYGFSVNDISIVFFKVPNRYKTYHIHRKEHNPDGPAIIKLDGSLYWYINGNKIKTTMVYK